MRNQSKNQINLVLIRHGATRSNREHRYLGSTEESLSAEGKAELFELRENAFYPEVDRLFTSPMKRCMETADVLYPDTKSIGIPEWKEMDFGEFEGKNYLDLKGDARYQAWIDSNGTLPFPNGESREMFISRCCDGIKKMCQLLEKEEIKTVGIIAHGGTMMALLSTYYGGEYFDYQVSNGKGYLCVLTIQNGEITITELRKL